MLLSNHLDYLCMTLSAPLVTALYRRIASRLSEHILQRQILYRGHVSLHEGKVIRGESELWVEACQRGLRGSLGGGRNRVEAPWLKLLEAGKLIGAEGVTWDAVVAATFGEKTDEEWSEVMIEMVGVSEVSRDEVGRLLRRRQN